MAIKELDEFKFNGTEYQARVIVCDVVVAVNLDAPGLETEVFTLQEIC